MDEPCSGACSNATEVHEPGETEKVTPGPKVAAPSSKRRFVGRSGAKADKSGKAIVSKGNLLPCAIMPGPIILIFSMQDELGAVLLTSYPRLCSTTRRCKKRLLRYYSCILLANHWFLAAHHDQLPSNYNFEIVKTIHRTNTLGAKRGSLHQCEPVDLHPMLQSHCSSLKASLCMHVLLQT